MPAHPARSSTPSAVRAAGKALLGYSDVTVLHLWQLRHAGLTGFHAPMLEHGAWREEELDAVRAALAGSAGEVVLRRRGARRRARRGTPRRRLAEARRDEPRHALRARHRRRDPPARGRRREALRHRPHAPAAPRGGKARARRGRRLRAAGRRASTRSATTPTAEQVIEEVLAPLGLPLVSACPSATGAPTSPGRSACAAPSTGSAARWWCSRRGSSDEARRDPAQARAGGQGPRQGDRGGGDPGRGRARAHAPRGRGARVSRRARARRGAPGARRDGARDDLRPRVAHQGDRDDDGGDAARRARAPSASTIRWRSTCPPSASARRRPSRCATCSPTPRACGPGAASTSRSSSGSARRASASSARRRRRSGCCRASTARRWCTSRARRRSTATSTSSSSARWSRRWRASPSSASWRSACSRPLGLAETGYVPIGEGAPPLSAARRQRFAATENCPWRGRILWGEVHDPNASVMGGVAGHAGLFAPADDVMRFAEALLDAWHGRPLAAPRRGGAPLRRAPEPAGGLRLGARLGHADARAARARGTTSRAPRSATWASPARRSGSTSSARRSW